MVIEKVHCLFEQSGTFKEAFQKLGIEAYDYDIHKTEKTDVCTDLFKQIEVAFEGLYSCVFSQIKKEDLIFAFFPCTYFSDQSQLLSRGDSFGCRKWTLEDKLTYSARQMEIRAEYYKYLCHLVLYCIRSGLRLVIENPSGREGFLRQYFPEKPKLIIYNRRAYGDYFRKPTQFFFINCEPEFNLQNWGFVDKKDYKQIEKLKGFPRSKISPAFAESFIRNYLL